MRYVITPVGTSLFTNGAETENDIKHGYNRIKDKPESQWAANRSSINALRTYSQNFIATQKISASAELQSTAKIQNELKSDITVHLLASDTIASRLAAEILSGNVASTILDPNVSVKFDAKSVSKPDIISGLQVNNRKDFLRMGMNFLIRRIDQIYKTLKSNESLAINITGGYGATLPYLTIYAQLKHVPLYYNFEDSNELIEIPHSPLTIDWNKIGPHFDVLQKIDNGEAINNWRKFEGCYYREVEMLGPFVWVDKHDDSAYLSPLGEAFWDEYLKRKHHVPFPNPATIAPDQIEEVENRISGEAHHRPTGWRAFVKRLCENAYVEYVRYDGRVHSGQNIKVLDGGEEGRIGVRYDSGRDVLPLCVETTAREKRQTELVMEFIKREFKSELNLKS